MPFNLEVREFTYKKGDKKGQQGSNLAFRLRNPLTEVSGSLDFDAMQDVHRDRITEAAERGETLTLVCSARCQRYEKDGEVKDFATLSVRGIDG